MTRSRRTSWQFAIMRSTLHSPSGTRVAPPPPAAPPPPSATSGRCPRAGLLPPISGRTTLSNFRFPLSDLTTGFSRRSSPTRLARPVWHAEIGDGRPAGARLLRHRSADGEERLLEAMPGAKVVRPFASSWSAARDTTKETRGNPMHDEVSRASAQRAVAANVPKSNGCGYFSSTRHGGVW